MKDFIRVMKKQKKILGPNITFSLLLKYSEKKKNE